MRAAHHNFTTVLFFFGEGEPWAVLPQGSEATAGGSAHGSGPPEQPKGGRAAGLRVPPVAPLRAALLRGQSRPLAAAGQEEAPAPPQPPLTAPRRAERPLTHAKSTGSMGLAAPRPSRRAAGRRGRGGAGAGSGGSPPHPEPPRAGGFCEERGRWAAAGSAFVSSPDAFPVRGGEHQVTLSKPAGASGGRRRRAAAVLMAAPRPPALRTPPAGSGSGCRLHQKLPKSPSARSCRR